VRGVTPTTLRPSEVVIVTVRFTVAGAVTVIATVPAFASNVAVHRGSSHDADAIVASIGVA
jgi:hypothetical protein